MRATLRFSLPEDQDAMKVAWNGSRYHSAITDLDRFLRNKVKHAQDGVSSEVIEAYQEIRDELWLCIANNGVSEDFE